MKSKIVVAGLWVITRLWAVALLLGATGAPAQIAGLYYQEVEKDGRVYVFNDAERAARFEATGELGTGITMVGAGVNGVTVVRDSERALQQVGERREGAGPGRDRRSQGRRGEAPGPSAGPPEGKGTARRGGTRQAVLDLQRPGLDRARGAYSRAGFPS